MKKIFAFIASIIIGLSFLYAPVAQAETVTNPADTYEPIFFSSCSDSSNRIFCILKIVVDVMTVGIGILGAIGITIVGIQYLTAGGNEEKTRKAKRRMFEIVIGLIAYFLIYALLAWLLPTFNGVNNPSSTDNPSSTAIIIQMTHLPG